MPDSGCVTFVIWARIVAVIIILIAAFTEVSFTTSKQEKSLFACTEPGMPRNSTIQPQPDGSLGLTSLPTQQQAYMPTPDIGTVTAKPLVIQEQEPACMPASEIGRVSATPLVTHKQQQQAIVGEFAYPQEAATTNN
eukprot:g83123.t1